MASNFGRRSGFFAKTAALPFLVLITGVGGYSWAQVVLMALPGAFAALAYFLLSVRWKHDRRSPCHQGPNRGRCEAPPTQGRDRYGLDAVLAPLLLVFVAPIAWMIMLSFQSDRAVISMFWELDLTLGNITAILADDQPFRAQLVNSLLIVAGVAGSCAVVPMLPPILPQPA
ncbi:MAG TPA: hypothetical protein VGN93_09690 [Shinella sp.]|jgi:hypothetical protein|uniref:hypothetical protein n=1 Tax=Shinella sp. TaxID=1870904 RepID=UPI002E1498C6|nr:hypothetical protein [Shinella sp.]